MTSMNVSLPESMREWIDKRLAEGGYGTASELVRDLIRREQLRLEREAINEQLLEALESPSQEVVRRLADRPEKRAG